MPAVDYDIPVPPRETSFTQRPFHPLKRNMSRRRDYCTDAQRARTQTQTTPVRADRKKSNEFFENKWTPVLPLRGELDEVKVELLGGLVEAVLVDGLDALGGQPQPYETVPLLPVKLAPLEVQVLHLRLVWNMA